MTVTFNQNNLQNYIRYFILFLFPGFQYLSSSGVMVNLPAPTEEKSIQSLTVSDEERIAHYEFFDCTSAVKTPDRYLKIRNYLVDAW